MFRKTIFQSFLLTSIAMATSLPSLANECVRIYYDSSPNPFHINQGRMRANYLQNLLGHFPDIQQIVKPISQYQAGEMNSCRATLYLNWSDSADVPSKMVSTAFIQDFSTTKRNVAWIGNFVSGLGAPALKDLFGLQYRGEVGLDYSHLDETGMPTFYKNILYKNEMFKKSISKINGEWVGAFWMSEVEKLNDKSEVIAIAQHSYSGKRIPYIVRSSNRFLVLDNPFLNAGMDDRYVVFGDVLFDIVDLKSHRSIDTKPPAVLRIEDVHPCTPIHQLVDIMSVVNEFHIPIQVALIPIFRNPFGKMGYCSAGTLPMNQKADFLQILEDMKRAGASFVWHGVTHQYENQLNPRSGVSADDFEFWNFIGNAPVALDNPFWILNRLDWGWGVLQKSNVLPQIWETPHYAASALDYLIFGRVFSWSIGCVKYWPFTATGVPVTTDLRLQYEESGLTGSSIRKKAFRNLSVHVASNEEISQFYPYEIYGDMYGQRVLPENLGYVTPYKYKSNDPFENTIENILERARRNRKLRDIWGSFFFHPSRMGNQSSDPERKERLRRLIQTMISFGYEFISTERFIQDKKNILRPEPIIF
ncbi:MAG: DUF2334 domain-containing protein [Bdellovibrionia bacterium]